MMPSDPSSERPLETGGADRQPAPRGAAFLPACDPQDRSEPAQRGTGRTRPGASEHAQVCERRAAPQRQTGNPDHPRFPTRRTIADA